MNKSDDSNNQVSPAKKPEKNSADKSELRSRIIYGLLLAACAFFLSWLGGVVFQVFVALVSIIMYDEYRRLCGSALPKRISVLVFAFILLNMAAWISQAYNTAIILSLLGFLALWAWEFTIKRTAWGAFGLIYVLLPFFSLVHLRGNTQEGFAAILLLFALVWGADTMAFVVGKTLGGPKLIPKISPGKTWSGFFGGLFGGMVIGWLVMKLFGYSAKPAFAAVALFLVFFSQIGDLVESALKRKFDVKDSGMIIPGHGGVLDRVDGLIFTSVIAWLFALALSNVFFGTWTWEPAFALISSILTR